MIDPLSKKSGLLVFLPSTASMNSPFSSTRHATLTYHRMVRIRTYKAGNVNKKFLKLRGFYRKLLYSKFL